jgi:hypothetical protein
LSETVERFEGRIFWQSLSKQFLYKYFLGPMAPAGIEETMAVMGDLQRVFESREDADRIVKIQRKCEEAMQLIAARERHMADVIAGKPHTAGLTSSSAAKHQGNTAEL